VERVGRVVTLGISDHSTVHVVLVSMENFVKVKKKETILLRKIKISLDILKAEEK
jgi:hypothetical protein